jgi:hypothetical protein
MDAARLDFLAANQRWVEAVTAGKGENKARAALEAAAAAYYAGKLDGARARILARIERAKAETTDAA